MDISLDKRLENIIEGMRDDLGFINRAISFHKSRKEHDVYSYFIGRKIQIEEYLETLEGIYFDIPENLRYKYEKAE